MSLRLDWCSHEAAKWACENWHYSKSIPTPPVIRIGIWEDSEYKGCILFSRGATPSIGCPYNLGCVEVCELTRIALKAHQTPVSRIIKIAIKLLKERCKGLRLIVSYADANQNHHGGIYQATNWIYTGTTASVKKYKDIYGRLWHSRQVSVTGKTKQYGEYRKCPKPSECIEVLEIGKHKYLMPLDSEMRKQIEPLRKPYPKRASVVQAEQQTFQSENGSIKSDLDAPKLEDKLCAN